MKLYLYIFLISGLCISSPAIAGDSDDAAILQEVDRLVSLMSDGPASLVEEASLIKYVSCLSGMDSKEAAIVLFNIESFGGGNNSRQFMAIFSRGIKDGGYPDWPFHEWRLYGVTKVGSDWDRWFSEINCKENRITLSGVSWIEGKDAHCCPSGTVQADFLFSPYSIHEVP